MASSTRGTQTSSASIATNIAPLPIPNPNPNPIENLNQPPTPTSECATDPNVGHPPLPPKVGTKRKGEKSEVWTHFTRLKLPDGNPDPLHCKCNYCGDETIKCHTVKNGTSSQWAHVRRCMVNPLYEPLDRNQKILNRDNITGAVTYHQFSQARCDQKGIKYIIRDELPFRHVEGGMGFKEFIYELQPRYKQPSRKVIARGVWDLYQTEKAKLMSDFAAHSTRVSVTTDTWTSIQNVNYMVITAHFLDTDWKLHKIIINFCAITSHKGEDIGRVLEHCLRQWGINNIFTITVDNASANDVVVAYMSRRLRCLKSLSFDGDFLHLRCACHIINLIVKDGISEIEDGIDAIWHCVKFIRSSSSRLDKFREFYVLENMNKSANVPLDVITRWNNTYLMLNAALKYEKVFDRMAEEDRQFQSYFTEKDAKGKTRVGPPTEEDWRNAQAFVHFLKKIYDSTLKLSAWKTVTANMMFSEMIGLQSEIDNRIKDLSDLVLQRVAIGMKAKFDKYWGSFEGINKIIIVANILDSRWKMSYQNRAFRKVGASTNRLREITSELKTILLRMYDEYRGSDATSSQPNLGSSGTTLDGVDLGRVDLDESQADIFADLMQERIDENAMLLNDVDKYLVDRFVNPLIPGFDIAQWWKSNASTYPTLSKLAKDILAIPCSTVASENAFSLGSRVVDPFRSSLTPQMVEALVCTSDWLKAEQPNLYKEPTIEEMELYQALEDLEKESTEAFGRKESSSTPRVTIAPAITGSAASAGSAASTGFAASTSVAVS